MILGLRVVPAVPLILQKSNPYPIHGDLTKVINYQDTRDISLSKKEGGKMEASINMNNNTLYYVKDPEGADQATNKKYVEKTG